MNRTFRRAASAHSAMVWLLVALLSFSVFLQNSRAAYLNPNSGRFWTSDSFEGEESTPLSLHKYSYCEGNPVNNTDPKGQSILLFKFKDKNGKITKDRFRHPKMRDLIASLDKAIKDSTPIDEIHIKAHGETHAMYVNGGGRLSPSSYTGEPGEYFEIKNGRIVTGTNDDLTDKFRQAMGSGSLIVLDGCETARGIKSIAQELSKVLRNVTVAGGAGWRQFGGLIGSSVAIGKKNYYINGDLVYSAW